MCYLVRCPPQPLLAPAAGPQQPADCLRLRDFAQSLFLLSSPPARPQGSRVSQIARNLRRRSAEGLAPGMFCLAIAGNLSYGAPRRPISPCLPRLRALSLARSPNAARLRRPPGASVLLRVHTVPELFSSAPWILGSLGTVALDMCIVGQTMAFAPSARAGGGAGGEADAARAETAAEAGLGWLRGDHGGGGCDEPLLGLGYGAEASGKRHSWLPPLHEGDEHEGGSVHAGQGGSSTAAAAGEAEEHDDGQCCAGCSGAAG